MRTQVPLMRTELTVVISCVLTDLFMANIVLMLLLKLTTNWADHVVGILSVLHGAHWHVPTSSLATFLLW